MRSRIVLLIFLLLIVQSLGFFSASAAVTWSQVSKFDTSYDGKNPNSNYDLEFSSVYIFDNDTDLIYFYLEFAQVPKVGMFNDGLNSFGFIGLDYDFNDKEDIRLYVDKVTMKTNRESVPGYAYDLVNSKTLTCSVGVFTNIDDREKWVGLKVSRSCIKLPTSFEMYGYAEYNDKGNVDSFDYAPYPNMNVNLLGSVGSTDPSTNNAISGLTHSLPTNVLNSSYKTSNFSEPPKDLSKLSEQLLPSVVTVICLTGSGTGWSADLKLSNALMSAGFQSLVITNHHVIEDCITTKNVTMVLSNGKSVPGKIVSWNSSNDVAGVATVATIPSLQWIGTLPRQGWWVGVLGSPLGKSNVLTTGIISSINNLAKTFTLTAPINPGNSGGPVFDSTGRVLGLATSKNILSSGQLAEGFGNAHGVPLLCASVVICELEKDPWNSISKSEIASLDAATVAKAEADAKAKAAAELKAKQEADAAAAKAIADAAAAKAAAELKAKQEAEAKAAAEKLIADAKAEAERILAAEKLIADAKAAADKFAAEKLIADAKAEAERILAVAAVEKLIADAKAEAERILAAAKAAATKKITITCTKGKLIKKVTAVKPKCPTGYKKK